MLSYGKRVHIVCNVMDQSVKTHKRQYSTYSLCEALQVYTIDYASWKKKTKFSPSNKFKSLSRAAGKGHTHCQCIYAAIFLSIVPTWQLYHILMPSSWASYTSACAASIAIGVQWVIRLVLHDSVGRVLSEMGLLPVPSSPLNSTARVALQFIYVSTPLWPSNRAIDSCSWLDCASRFNQVRHLVLVELPLWHYSDVGGVRTKPSELLGSGGRAISLAAVQILIAHNPFSRRCTRSLLFSRPIETCPASLSLASPERPTTTTTTTTLHTRCATMKGRNGRGIIDKKETLFFFFLKIERDWKERWHMERRRWIGHCVEKRDKCRFLVDLTGTRLYRRTSVCAPVFFSLYTRSAL